MSAEGMMWDWRGQPDLDALDRIVANMTNCRIRIHQVDTGSDDCAILITDEDFDGKQQIRERWEGVMEA